MISALLLAILAQSAGPHNNHTRENRRTGGRSQVGLQYAFFEAFPLSGAGTHGACSTTPPTGAKGEALVFARASVAECYSNDGQTLTQMASGVPRVSSGSVQSSQLGIWRELASQNDLLHARDMGNAAWVKANMSCVRDQPGMRGGDANGATRCTATAPNATVCQTITTAAATRNSSGHIKRAAGTGAVEVARDGATYTAITSSLSSALWRRVVAWEAPGCAGGNCIVVAGMTSGIANPQVCVRLATSGDAVDLDFWQDEAGDNPTSPIATVGAAAPRAAESGYFTTAPFVARSISLKTQNSGPLSGGFQTAMGVWQDNNNVSVIWCATSGFGICRCTNYKSGIGNAEGFVYLPQGAATSAAVGCELTDSGSTTWKQQGVGVTTAGLGAPNLVTRVYIGTTPLGGTSMSGVAKDMCADPVTGRCDPTAFDSNGSPVVALGDSITLGSQQLPTRWVSGLTRAINRQVFNLGQTGQSAAVCLSDYRSHVRGKGYSAITVLCGVNSLIAGDSAASVWATLQTLLDEARADGLVVKVGTILPWASYATSSPAKQAETLTLNASILAYCSTHSLGCVDFHGSALNDGSGNLAGAYNSGDNIHPNAAGGVLMAGLWAAVFP